MRAFINMGVGLRGGKRALAGIATGASLAATTVTALAAGTVAAGVAVSESAGAFARFALAAREVGTTNSRVPTLVRTCSRPASSPAPAPPGPRRASCKSARRWRRARPQGDEFRSSLENMPAAAETLARQLGVGADELRKMDKEGIRGDLGRASVAQRGDGPGQGRARLACRREAATTSFSTGSSRIPWDAPQQRPERAATQRKGGRCRWPVRRP